MKCRIALALAFCLVAASAYAQQQGRMEERPPEAPATQEDAQQQVQQRLAKWRADKQACYESAGLQPGRDYRQNPENPAVLQVNDRVWLSPGMFDLAKLRACR